MARRKPIADVLSDLMARRGYGRVQSAGMLSESWRQAADEQLGAPTRPGWVRRGGLALSVCNSTLGQEMSFQKTALIKKLGELVPDVNIRDLRFKVGPID